MIDEGRVARLAVEYQQAVENHKAKLAAFEAARAAEGDAQFSLNDASSIVTAARRLLLEACGGPE